MPQQTLNSENNTAVVWMTQTTETVSFPESGAILSTKHRITQFREAGEWSSGLLA